MSNKNFLIIFTVVALALGGVLYLIYPTPSQYEEGGEPEERACTLEAKLCPDGSYVGRTGPNCEFSPCPPPPEGTLMEDGTILDSTE